MLTKKNPVKFKVKHTLRKGFFMNRKMEFPNYKVFETEFAGRPLKIETGKMTQLANGACLVSYGETVVHVAVTASAKPRERYRLLPALS